MFNVLMNGEWWCPYQIGHGKAYSVLKGDFV